MAVIFPYFLRQTSRTADHRQWALVLAVATVSYIAGMMLPLTVAAEPALTQRWLLLPHAVEAGLDFSGTDFDDGGWKPITFPNTEGEF